MNLAIILPTWIGDAIMATPTLRAIRRRFPQARITAVARPLIAKLLEGTSFYDDWELYDRRSNNSNFHGQTVARSLRQRQIDKAVVLPNSLRTAYLAWRSGARRRIGYARDGRSLLLTDKLRPPRRRMRYVPIPAIDYYLQLAYRLGCPEEPPAMELAILPQDEKGGEQVWNNLGLYRFERVVLFNPGSAGSPARRWPTEHYVNLARRIVADERCGVVVLCGPGEENLADEIVTKSGHPHVQSMTGQDLSLGVSKAIIRRGQLVITGDTGPRHIAHAFDTPTIVLSGPIEPLWSESYHPQAITLQHAVPCGPCGKNVCPLADHPCLRGLTVERVFAAVQHQFSKTDRPQRASPAA